MSVILESKLGESYEEGFLYHLTNAAMRIKAYPEYSAEGCLFWMLVLEDGEEAIYESFEDKKKALGGLDEVPSEETIRL
jgi:hypothetical protein